ncbi:MAG: phosphatase PAP2 family protein [Gemmatimonadota bacterium]|jgi:undecaprenyl-diphosphatase
MNTREERRRKPRGRLKVFGNILYRTLRFIARHVRSFYGAVLTYLSFSFFVGIGAVWAFAVTADTILEGSTQRLDEAVLAWIGSHRTPTLDRVALEVTALGNFATLTVLVLAVSVFLWLTRHKFSVALLMMAVAGGIVLNTLLKDLFDRPRPTLLEWGTEVASESFPSGHSMGAFIAYAGVAYLGGRLEPTPRLRWTTWGIAGLLILAIGISRVYLGVHYPSDVVGGYLAGLAWLAFVISGVAAIRYYAGRNPGIDSEEGAPNAGDAGVPDLRE